MIVAAGLSYFLAHPQVPALTVQRPAALALLALVAIFCAVGPRAGRAARTTLGLRALACTLVVLALAGVGLSTAVPHDRLSLTAVVDRSQSIDADGRRWTQRYVDQVRAGLAADDEFAVVAFGGDVAVVQPPGPPRGVDLNAAPVAEGATDIGRALQTAIALFPADGERRVLLLTDGNETRGNVLAEVPRAQRAGIAIFAAAPPHTRRIDMAVDKLTVPPLVTDGSVFSVRLTLRNDGPPRTADLTLAIDGGVVGRQPVTLQSGLNAVEVPYRLAGPGSHRLRAELSGLADAIPGNNWREATLMIGSPLRVLLVGRGRSSALARALERKDAAITRVTPQAAPTTVDALGDYQCVILEDPTVRSLTAGALQALQAYVRDLGGGLVIAGGGESFVQGGFSTTPLEALLPVTLEPQRPPRADRAPLGLIILLDRSNSMGFHIQNRLEHSDDQSKLAYAKRAALAVITQLQERDHVGVITFDSQAFDVARLRPVNDNRAPLLRDIPRLQPGGGTDFYDALESARRQLAAARLATKHIMLLTDGDTNRPAAAHESLIAALAADGISVTTIRIGDDTINLNLLRELAARTGGQFHHVENARQLPELLLRDTSRAVGRLPRGPDRFAARTRGQQSAVAGDRRGRTARTRGLRVHAPAPGRRPPRLRAGGQTETPAARRLAVWARARRRVHRQPRARRRSMDVVGRVRQVLVATRALDGGGPRRGRRRLRGAARQGAHRAGGHRLRRRHRRGRRAGATLHTGPGARSDPHAHRPAAVPRHPPVAAGGTVPDHTDATAGRPRCPQPMQFLTVPAPGDQARGRIRSDGPQSAAARSADERHRRRGRCAARHGHRTPTWHTPTVSPARLAVPAGGDAAVSRRRGAVPDGPRARGVTLPRARRRASRIATEPSTARARALRDAA